MSQNTAAARTMRNPAVRPAVRPVTGDTAPRLRVVASGPSTGRTRLVVLCLALMGGGLLALLMLNVSLSRGAYELDAVQASNQVLAERVQAASEDVEAQRAPQQLAARARALGMVPAPNTAFVRLADGTVIGDAKVAPSPPAPKPSASSPPAATGTASTAAPKTAATTGATPKAAVPKGTATKAAVPKGTAGKGTAATTNGKAGAKTSTAPTTP